VYRVVSEVSMVAVVFKNIKINNIFQKQAWSRKAILLSPYSATNRNTFND
jgi:hypothetical protein